MRQLQKHWVLALLGVAVALWAWRTWKDSAPSDTHESLDVSLLSKADRMKAAGF